MAKKLKNLNQVSGGSKENPRTFKERRDDNFWGFYKDKNGNIDVPKALSLPVTGAPVLLGTTVHSAAVSAKNAIVGAGKSAYNKLFGSKN